MLIFLVLLLLCGCQGSPELRKLDGWMRDSGKIKVLSTTGMIDDIVGQIGGEEIDRITLIVGDVDPHTYEIVKGDAEKVSFADVVFANGLGLEHGASLRYQMKRHPNVAFLGERVPQEQLIYLDGAVDPHIWTDMALFAHIIDPIVERLSLLRPERAAVFAERGRAVKRELLAVHEELRAKMAAVPEERRYLVTSHDAFHYFARAYLGGEERFAAPEGLAPEGQMSAFDIQEILSFLRDHKVRVVFPESNLSRGALKKIEDAYGAVVLANTELYGDSMGKAETYIGMMRHNVDEICRYLDD